MPSWLFEHGHSSSASTQAAAMTPSTLPVVDFVDDKHVHHPATPPNNSKIQLPPPVLQKPRSYLSRTNYGYLRALKSFWARTRGPSNPQYPPSMVASVNDSLQESQFEPFQLDSDGGNQEVDEIVVDQPWSDTYEPVVSLPKDTTGDIAEPIVTKCRPTSLLGRILRWMMERYRDFFSSKFDDVEMERRFSEENWDSQRRPAFWSAIFMIINWVLGCAFIVQPMVLADKIFYFLFGPLLSIPLIWMIMIGFPLKHAITYQIFLCASIWSWSFYQVLFSFLCGYYGVPQGSFSCGTRDFLTIFYYTSALQTVALFGLGLKRFPAALGALIFFVMSSGMILNFKISWIRNSINFAVYEAALIYMHWQREHVGGTSLFSADEPELMIFVKHERRLFTLRQQVKLQYKVRVPLNTALLAVQNMEASGAITKRFEIEFNALEGSLSMMSKGKMLPYSVAPHPPNQWMTVLNDVLDFNRMDSGKFESSFRPYPLHQVMRSLFIPLQLAANARHLQFETSLDPRIDTVARREAYRAMGRSQEEIKQLLEEDTEAAGMVVGDETRLRQIVTNLASNACKFTPAGGRLGIKTRLIFPPPGEHAGDSGDRPPSNRRSTETNRSSSLASRIVVRIEVSDTGWGIRAKDMADARLFSAFTQTEQGRQQGGKGTGLGLALVRQIVNLSGGRLGVKSKVGEGSTFWVELPLGVGAETLELSSLPPVPSLTGCGRQTHRVSKVYDFVEDGTNCFRDSASVLSGGEGGGPSARRSLHSIMDQVGRVELSLSSYNPSSLLHKPSGPSPSSEVGAGSDVEPPAPAAIDVSRTSSQHSPSVQDISPEATNIIQEAVSFIPDQPSLTLIPPTPDPVNSTPPTPTFSGLLVLVVDDDSITRMLMRRMLSRIGCTVETAENGEAALAMILRSQYSADALENPEDETSNGPYDVVFMDNQMPVMSGLTAVAKLRALGRHDFIVGVTGNALLTDQHEYMEAGVDKVLTKPVLEKSLKEMLSLALGRSHTSRPHEKPP
ncbi:hypothetical protein CCMSSC00406_0004339 [Pleurotus cornucopiae]|uniref:Uncharacterized protein n=1 Tax=Pleurotus cornucopiae TaxID=5321 RepID=A0ACB7J1E8_PLECO|nr:hypothetical protein CCMSSC00406_0004339 [Pleurotus cornucopiae]